MKGLIICSVHALCDISKFERAAYHDACQRHGIQSSLTVRDHASLLAQSNMLAILHRLPGPQRERRVLIESYLEILNDHIWNASIPVYQSVFSALLDPFGYARPRSFLSDYPMLTTNLARSSTPLTNATRLGCLTVPSDPLRSQCTADGLSASAASLGLAHQDIEVLVAHQRDFDAARSIGMHPRFVKEVSPVVTEGRPINEHRLHDPEVAIITGNPTSPIFAACA